MKRDPEILASAAACREMQECHKIYNRAEKLMQSKPASARELFDEILRRAPPDSEIHRMARKHIQAIESPNPSPPATP
jgi:hypothetical protein